MSLVGLITSSSGAPVFPIGGGSSELSIKYVSAGVLSLVGVIMLLAGVVAVVGVVGRLHLLYNL